MAQTDTSSPSFVALDASEAELRARLAAQPDDAEAMARLAVKCADDGRMAEARELAGKALEQRPDEPRYCLMAAGMAANDDDLDQAEGYYRRALRFNDKAPDGHVGLGNIALLRNQVEQAKAYFDTALGLDGQHPDALLGRARVHMEQGEAEAAVQLSGQVVQANPGHARALTGYAEALMRRGTPQQAARPLKRALELEPTLGFARLLLGHVELMRGNGVAAEKAYRGVLKDQPSNADALAGLGDALRAQQRLDEAFLAYDAARRRYPDAEMLTALRNTCLGAMGREDEAVEDLRAWTAKHPRSTAPRLLLSDIMRRRGDMAGLTAMWQQAADTDPEDALAFTQLALLHERRGDFARASETAGRSVADKRPMACLLRARMALRDGDHDAARKELLALQHKQLPDDLKRDRLRLLGQAHDRAERWAEAALAFREAHRIGARPLPGLMAPEALRPTIDHLLTEAELLHPRLKTPVLLLGLPGSGVEKVAALLADQKGLAVREDRMAGDNDFFPDAIKGNLMLPLSQSALGVQARRYARQQARVAGTEGAGQVIDWLPAFDARALPVAKLALPGLRVIIVDAEPEFAFLRWLAFGWQSRLRIQDSVEAARWFKRAGQQIELAAELLPAVRVNGDALIADPAVAGSELADFLSLDAIVPGPLLASSLRVGRGLLDHFQPGHEKHYREVLSDSFAALA